MLTDAEIVALYRGMEADRVERKRDYKSAADKIKQAICAFANDFPDRRVPGVVFVGQNDDGSCAGIDVNDELLLNLGGLRTEILPFPVMSVARKQIDGCTVAIIEVAPSRQPPVRVDGRTWIRVGPLLAEGLKNLGVVERFGFGLVKTRKALADNGNPPLGFQFESISPCSRSSPRDEIHRLLQQQGRRRKDVADLPPRVDVRGPGAACSIG